ncbi:MAG: hypothetical protein KC543_09060, partial [Myxococcales bacterium]|nr:hypothetical protein [Myxococcales bacterium]
MASTRENMVPRRIEGFDPEDGRFDDELRRVLACVDGQADVDTLAARTGLSLQGVDAALARLSSAGAVVWRTGRESQLGATARPEPPVGARVFTRPPAAAVPSIDEPSLGAHRVAPGTGRISSTLRPAAAVPAVTVRPTIPGSYDRPPADRATVRPPRAADTTYVHRGGPEEVAGR